MRILASCRHYVYSPCVFFAAAPRPHVKWGVGDAKSRGVQGTGRKSLSSNVRLVGEAARSIGVLRRPVLSLTVTKFSILIDAMNRQLRLKCCARSVFFDGFQLAEADGVRIEALAGVVSATSLLLRPKGGNPISVSAA
ncbi:hypothetical protein [Bradyrhizobium retamae]|uniref:hypothetical protein n=1 Tax=Bradyrhizobium retamae TaxID=1300035 RepID=UPI0018D2268C|nr:hypothetical protein [Bradyrhizobium retamae]